MVFRTPFVMSWNSAKALQWQREEEEEGTRVKECWLSLNLPLIQLELLLFSVYAMASL